MKRVITARGVTEEELIRHAAGVAEGSGHPVAHSVVHAARGMAIPIVHAAGIQSRPGDGLVERSEHTRVALGSIRLMAGLGWPAPPELRDAINGKVAQSVVYVGWDNLPPGGLTQLPRLITLARRIRKTIITNLVWAFGYNLVAIGAAGAGLLQPAFAAALMAGSSLFVVLNSLSLSGERGHRSDRRGRSRLHGARDSTFRRHFILFTAVLLGIAGCATPRSAVMESFAAAANCCRSMSEFRYEPLEVGQSRSFDLDARSAAFLFPTGKSYFRAFALPDAEQGYSLRVQSFMMGDHLGAAYLFFPQVLTLDAQYRVVRTMPPEAFALKRASYAETARETWGLPWKLEGALAFTPANASERYLVVLTTEELMKRRTSMETLRIMPVILPGVVSAIPTGKKQVVIPHSPAGHLNISLLP